jgi:hypothetical protein
MTDLAARIADVKQKAEVAIEATTITALKRDWGAFQDAASPELILAMAAQIKELKKALEPFAKAAEELIPGTPDEAGVMWDGIVAMANAGHLRTAARTLKN